MASPLFGQFASLLNSAIENQDGDALLRLLPIEPPLPPDYDRLLHEVYAVFETDDSFKKSIQQAITVIANDDKDAWHTFADFLATYFEFIREVNIEDLLDTYEKLSNLLT
jgi:hypothetical protein